jgi:DNA-binding PadR family transcriptional regulator
MAQPKLSPDETIILKILADGKERYGLQIVEESSGRLSRELIYMVLYNMEDKSLIESYEEPTSSRKWGRRKRLYKIIQS